MDELFTIGKGSLPFIELLNTERKAKLMDAIIGKLNGEEPTINDKPTDIVWNALVAENEQFALIYSLSKVLQFNTDESERNKKKVDAKASTKEKKERVADFVEDNPSVKEAFRRFSQMREQIGKPLSTVGRNRARIKLERLSEGKADLAVAIIEQSIENLWEGLYELNDKQPEKTGGAGRSAKVQNAFGFSTERTDNDLNAAVWERIRAQWAAEDEEEKGGTECSN